MAESVSEVWQWIKPCSTCSLFVCQFNYRLCKVKGCFWFQMLVTLEELEPQPFCLSILLNFSDVFSHFFSIVFVSFCSLTTSLFPKLSEINFALERSSAFLTGSYGFTLPLIWNKSSFGKLRGFTEPRSDSRLPCIIKMWLSEMLSQEDLES